MSLQKKRYAIGAIEKSWKCYYSSEFLSLPEPEELFHSGEGIKVGYIKKLRMLLRYLIAKVNIRW